MLLLCCAGVPEAGAQSWKFVDVIQMADLEYGMVVQQTGEVARSKTDPAVAVFKVYAKLPTSAPQVSILLYPPAALTGPGGATVPYEMTAAYNTSANNPAGATVMNGTSAVITPQIDEGDDGPGPNVRSAYVYVYGSVTVGTQPAGPYTGEITLVAEEGFSEELPTECDAPAWDPAIAYYAEDWVVHAGHAWQARYYTMGNEPGTSTSGPWDDMGPCDGTPLDGIECEAPPWSAFRAYDTDAWATYDGSAWQALYYVQGEVPGSLGSSGAWEEMGPCDGTVWGGTQCDALPWAESRIYNTGDRATYVGILWQANWYSRGAEPGVSGAWSNVQSCNGL